MRTGSFDLGDGYRLHVRKNGRAWKAIVTNNGRPVNQREGDYVEVSEFVHQIFEENPPQDA